MAAQRDLESLLTRLAAAYGSDLAVASAAACSSTAPIAPASPQGPAAPAALPERPARAAAPATGEPPQAAAAAALQQLHAAALACQRCKLSTHRQHVVFGEGNPRARVVFVGEAPGAVEDRTGRPFVGPAGQLLDRILTGAMGLDRAAVYIANINKCRPPGNRAPEADEVAACLPFLRQQVEIIAPEVIVCLGRTAAQNLLGTTQSLAALRGQTLTYAGIPVVVTWHPAFLLRDPSRKPETWEDIKRVNRLLGLPAVPPRAANAAGRAPAGGATPSPPDLIA